MAKKVNVYNLEGQITGDVTLPKTFDFEPNDQLLAQFIRVYLANNRQGTRDTKDRSDVNGRAKKPHRQKGTGAARQGSKKAPSMRGGGVAHGPKPQNFSLKMSKTMRQKALQSAYAKQAEKCVVLEDANMTEVKTKSLTTFLDTAELYGSILFVTSDVKKNLILSGRNIQGLMIANAENVNAYDVLKANVVVLEKPVLDLIENKFGKKKSK